jgi:hypothetical protein
VVPTSAGWSRPVVFDDSAWHADISRASERARDVATAARRRFERRGLHAYPLIECDPEGRDGTRLAACVKAYLPSASPVRYAMVFLEAETIDKEQALLYLAFGVRHQQRGSRQLTVYQRAHERLRGTAFR